MTDFDTSYWNSLFAADPGDDPEPPQPIEEDEPMPPTGPTYEAEDDGHMFNGGPTWQPKATDVRDDLRTDSNSQLYFAQLLAVDQRDKLLHVHGIGWHHWDGSRWAPDEGEVAARNAVVALVKAEWPHAITDKDLRRDIDKANTASGINGILDIAKILPELVCRIGELDADPWLLNCANGTLDLHTLQLRPHNPADRITKTCRAAYDPEAHSLEWDHFLQRSLPDPEVRAYLARFVGVALIGKVVEQEFTIATGEGANGKGVFYNALLHALGDYGHTMDPAVLIASRYDDGNAPKPALVELRGRRLVVTSETEKEVQLANALMKRLTGGDPIKARALRRDPIQFNPSHTLLMVTNHLPKVPGNDPATWRRIRVIPFDVVIPKDERDSQLGDRLEAELEAILAWAVAGLADYQQNGMAPPEAVVAATADYQKQSDAITRFLEACCYPNPHLVVAVAELWKAFETWANDDGADLSKREFNEEMDKRGYKTGTARVDGRVTKVRRGLGLQDLSEDDAA